MKPFCSSRVHFQGNACARLCLLRLQQCSTTFSQAINLNVELHSAGCLSQPFFWCYLQSKRSKALSVVRGSPRLLAYQPVIYVKIPAKRENEGKKKGKASEESILTERWHEEEAPQNPRAASPRVHHPRNGACPSALALSGSPGSLPKPAASHHPSCHAAAARTLPGEAADACQQRVPDEESIPGEPTSYAGQGEMVQDHGSARRWISTSATGSWATLNESRKSKPFASAFPLVKRG